MDHELSTGTRDRRAYLGLLAGAVTAGLGGCLGDGPTDGPGTDARSPTGTPTRTDTATATDTPAPTATSGESATGTTDDADTPTPGPTPTGGRLVAEYVDPDTVTAATVYPRDLASLLLQAADADGRVRASASAFVYAPEPILPSFETVRLVTAEGEKRGPYRVEGEAGIRYDHVVGAEQVEPPENATVTPVDDLAAERRDLAVAAIEGESPEVTPETELGEWVRESFYGAYVRDDGTTYRGGEIEQTDAAFFSTECWYILSLTPVDDGEGAVTLRLPDLSVSVRETFDTLFEETTAYESTGRIERDRFSADVVRFAAETDHLLTHTTTYTTALTGDD